MGDSGTPLLSVVQTRDGVWSLFPVNVLHSAVHLAIGAWGWR